MKRVIICLLLIFSLTGCAKNEECTDKNEKHTMYLTGDIVIKLEYEENYSLCSSGDNTYKKDKDTKVLKFELLNALAEDIYKEEDFTGMKISEVFNVIEDINDEIDIKVENVDIYSTSKEDYSNYLSFNVKNNYVTKEEIDKLFTKTIPLNKEFEFKVESGMEYYLRYYEFISDTEVKFHTKYLCYGECDEQATYKYTSKYDIGTDTLRIVIDDGYNNAFIYDFKTGELTHEE